MGNSIQNYFEEYKRLSMKNNLSGRKALEAVRKNGIFLQYVKNKTEKVCLEAVKQNGYALQYVHNKTKEICFEAVKQNGYALQFVQDQTEKICLEAIKQNNDALQYVNGDIFNQDEKEQIDVEAIQFFNGEGKDKKNTIKACIDFVERAEIMAYMNNKENKLHILANGGAVSLSNSDYIVVEYDDKGGQNVFKQTSEEYEENNKWKLQFKTIMKSIKNLV